MDEEEDVERCIVCKEDFDDDPDSIAKSKRSTSRLPIKSSKCEHLMCISCVYGTMSGKMELTNRCDKPIKWLDCPFCKVKTCFNTELPIVDKNVCALLRLLRSRKRQYESQLGASKEASKARSSSADNVPISVSVPSATSIASSTPTSRGGKCNSVDGSTSCAKEKQVTKDNNSHNSKLRGNVIGAGHKDTSEHKKRSEKDQMDSDEESRFSYLSEDDMNIGEEDMVQEKKCATHAKNKANKPIPQSSLITREQLHCLTGGVRGGYKNPLNVGTPMGFCGGRALATKNEQVQHICVKENINHPLPTSLDEEFLLYRTSKGCGLARDIQLLVNLQNNHPPIPIFWEPEDQAGTKVTYVGHWKVKIIHDCSDDPITYKNIKRCALVKFMFVHFNEDWARIIHLCHDKTPNEIKAMNWDDGVERDVYVSFKDNSTAHIVSKVARSKRKRGAASK